MSTNSRNIFYFSHLLADFVLITIAFILVTWIGGNHTFLALSLFDLGFLAYLLTSWYFISRSNALYADRVPVNQVRELLGTLKCLVILGVLMVLFVFAFQEKTYTRGFVLAYILILFFFMPLSKITLKRIFYWMYQKGVVRKKTIVIGDGATGQRFYEYISNHQYYGYDVVRFINGGLQLGTNTAGFFQRMGDISDVDEVFIAESEARLYNTREIAAVLSANAARLRIIPNTYGSSSTGTYQLSTLGDFPLLSIRNEPLEDIYNETIKRLFDICFSVLVMIFVCSWLFPIIALLIKLGSKGPVFYKQERWGKRNRPFMCYKFRSMYVAAPDTNASGKFQQAQKHDPRITPIGRFLRKTSLDEFPQFINVLMGHMSVVGPRPHASLMNRESLETVQNYLVRHQAKPGITGWAQVNGLRGESGDPELLKARVEHDIWYIEHWTFLLDLKIIFLTFWNMLAGDKQAY